MGDVVVEMKGISKEFPGVRALDAVDFDVKAGEVHVLLGENGAGKSTLMKILTGVYPRDAGSIWLEGKQVEIYNPRQALDLGISMVYQEFNLASHLSVAENIFLGREPTKLSAGGIIDWRAMSQQTKEILDRMRIPVSPSVQVRQLGVAKCQMIEIAKALSANARVIILDEPTAALTREEIEELFGMIRQLKSHGVAIVYISHRLEEIPQIGDRVTVLRDGKRIGTVPASTGISVLIQMMVGRELSELFPKERAETGQESLKVEGLTRRGVLQNISFSVHRGEILGIAGLVGSGRTELARAIFGADPIDDGAIFVDGKRVRINSPTDAISAGIGYLSEDRKAHGLALDMAVTANITLASLSRFCRYILIRKEKEQRAAQSFVEALSIRTPSLNRVVRYLSGGNQQKVVLAKWLCTEAKVLIFDEPTRGIDVGAKAEMFHLMNQLVKRGASVLMISSYLPEILAMSDRVLVMRGGQVAAELTRDEATQEKILYHAAVGKAC